MNILFIHQNFPGQFRAIAERLAADPTNMVLALRQNTHPVEVAGVDVITYRFVSKTLQTQHPWLEEMEAKVLRAEAVADACNRLRLRGWAPEVIIAHPGWGEAMLVKEIFPKARLICYLEYFYATHGQDFNFDPEFLDLTLASHAKLRLKNVPMLQALQEMDAAWTATDWQRSTFPAWAQEKIQVIHEGVDLEYFKPDPKAKFTIAGKNVTLTAKDEVITFACRALEPVRGFHVFMRALPALLKKRPKAHVVIMGAHQASYGTEPKDYANWPEKLLAEVGAKLDPARVHLVGFLPRDAYRAVLQVSKAHVYLTYPFILSWSVIEALACGVRLIASNTAPLDEVLTKEDAPYRFDFYDAKDMIAAVSSALQRTAAKKALEQKKSRSKIQREFSSVEQTRSLEALICPTPSKRASATRARPKAGKKPAAHKTARKR